MNTTKPNYRDLRRDWTIVIFNSIWIIRYELSSSYRLLRTVLIKWTLTFFSSRAKSEVKKKPKSEFCFDIPLKADSHLPKNWFVSFNKRPLKMMKKTFYFIFKAFFVLKILNFLSWFFDYVVKATWLEI